MSVLRGCSYFRVRRPEGMSALLLQAMSVSENQESQFVTFLLHISCAAHLGRFPARRLVIFVDASRFAAKADITGTRIFVLGG